MANFRLKLRHAVPSDIPGLLELDKEIYSGDSAADDGSIERRVMTFPEGVLIAEQDDIIKGAIYLRPLAKAVDPQHPLTWKQAENDGDFTPTEGFRFMYGVGFVGRGGMADIMTMAAMRLCVELGVEAGFFGSRIPTLSKAYPACPDHSEIQHYVVSGQDWEIKMYGQAAPLGLKMGRDESGMPIIIPEYFADPESYNFGVLWIWHNKWLGPMMKLVGKLFYSVLILVERFYIK